mmetsp:Transcript_9581/g.14371  ORF Transcript_9581/g.14371 Transcript_9581/m.14371 type:complete len:580 (-) Transcript_9581:1124-2863(-)
MSGGEADTGGDKTVSFAPEEEKSAKVLQQKLSMLQKQHELQSVSNSLSFPKPVTRLVFWTRPKQRQRWGDVDSHPKLNWGDLFFDLFYVASALNLSYVLFYSPSAEGVLYFTGLFGPILLEWFQRTFFDARFVWGDDPFHKIFELVHLCALSFAAVHIRPVSTMTDPTQPEMFDFSLAVTGLALLNMYRSIEVMLTVDGEDAAKRGEKRRLIDYFIQLAFYLAAAVKSGITYYGSKSTDENDFGNRGLESLTNACSRMLNLAPERDLAAEVDVEKDHIPIILCLCGWSSTVVFYLFRSYFLEKKFGWHKKYNVPMNIEYLIHRYGELVMLLLGESVLSILITMSINTVEYHVTFYAAIVSIALLQYSHYKYQPHSPREHACRRSLRGSVTHYAIMIVYCHALVAVGTAYKMFLSTYEVEASLKNKDLRHLVTTLMSRNLAGAADKTKFTTVEHKQAVANLFCISMAIVWLCLEAMWVSHVGWAKYKAFVKTKPGIFCDVLRTIGFFFMLTISSYTIEPEWVTLIALLGICFEIVTAVLTDYFWHKQFGDLDDDDDGHWPNVTEPDSVPNEHVDEHDDHA